MPDKDKIAVERNGQTVLIDKNSLAVYLKFGYKLKGKPKTGKEEK